MNYYHILYQKKWNIKSPVNALNAAESMDILRTTAEGLKKVCEELDINYVFKSSFDKANRSSITSYRGFAIKRKIAKSFLMYKRSNGK